MTEFHDDFTDLLGAYALDAVDPEERQRLDAHLHACPWCAAEVAEHREVAAFLSHSGTDAPPNVWDRIAAELSPPAPPLRMSFRPTGEVDPPAESDTAPSLSEPITNVVPFVGRRSVRTRTLAAGVSVAAVLLAVLGFVAVDQTRDANRIRDDVASGTIPRSPDDLSVELVGSNDRVGARAVVSSTGKGYLVPHDLPEPGSDELYQLWGQVDGVVLSLGTFGRDADVVNFQVDPGQLDGVEAFAVTKEQMPGVLASDHDPVLAGEVA